MEINSFDDLTGLGINQPTAPERSDDLGQEQFLELMIAQFSNQDPIEPMSNGDFLGQLAQFGTVSGINELQGSFAQLTESLYSEQALQAANLVGHSVLARTNQGFVAEGGSLSGAVELSSSANSVVIDITDSSGQLVRQLDLGIQGSGTIEFQWDGRNENQEPVAPGNYRISARAGRGINVENVETLIEADVESVTLGRAGQGMVLNLPGGTALNLSQIQRIL